MFDAPELKIEHVVLKKVAFGLQGRVSPSFINDLRFETLPDVVSNDLVYRLNGFLFSEDVKQEEITERVTTRNPEHRTIGRIDFPTTWWDYVKLTYKDWLQKRFGRELTVCIHYSPHTVLIEEVTETTIHKTIVNRRTCPHIDSSGSRNDRELHLRFMTGGVEL
jgi:hypothetical protein